MCYIFGTILKREKCKCQFLTVICAKTTTFSVGATRICIQEMKNSWFASSWSCYHFFFKFCVKIIGVRRIEKIRGETNEMTDIQVTSDVTDISTRLPLKSLT